uniref:Uncharacterized protein n=1 Tax=Kalanchoe fedtschenkoi TaxID=63787 RepID=A0A7N0V9P0_KALFE
MESEKPPCDVRFYIVVGIFFVCIVGGGISFAMFVFLPESPTWYATAGMVLVCIPWLFWDLTFIYTEVKTCRNARAMENNNNVGRVFHKSTLSQISRFTARERTSDDTALFPTWPANDRYVQSGVADILEDDISQEQEDGNSYDDDDDEDGRKKVESPTRGRASEIPLTSSASS